MKCVFCKDSRTEFAGESTGSFGGGGLVDTLLMWHRHILLEGQPVRARARGGGGGAERTAHCFLSLSEFVYMWKTTYRFPPEEIVIQSFITF